MAERTARRTSMQRPLLYAFDPLEHDGMDLRDLPLLEHKQGLARQLGRAKRQVIHFKEHLADDGPKVFKHVCWMGLEGIVSKRIDAPQSQRTIENVAQIEEPGKRGGAPGKISVCRAVSPLLFGFAALGQGRLLGLSPRDPRR